MLKTNKKAIYLFSLLMLSTFHLCAGIPLLASDKILSAGCYNNYPYEFLDNDGRPSGFTVELLTEITKTMKINHELLLLPPERMSDLIQKGESDIIIGGMESSGFHHYNYAGTAIEIPFSFAVRKDSGIIGINDMQSIRVAVTGHEVFSAPVSDIIRKVYKVDTVYISSPESAILLLTSNGCEAVFMRSDFLERINSRLADGSIRELSVNPGRFRCGFYVKKGNSELAEKIQTGLARINADGGYSRIYSRWFETQNKVNENDSYAFIALWFIFSAAVFLFFIYINTGILRKRIREKTAGLDSAIERLKKSEAGLTRSERKFRKIFNRAPVGIMVLDSSGKIIHFNEAIKVIFGIINEDEIYNLDVIESPHSTDWFKAMVRNYRSVRAEFRYDFDIIKETGFYQTGRVGEIIIDVSVSPFSIQCDDEAGYICHIVDVTSDRSLLQIRNEIIRRDELIFDSIRDGLWEWRLDNNSIRVNRQFLNMLGFRKEGFPQCFSGISTLIHPDDREEVCRLISEKTNQGRSFTVEYRILKNDGSWLWLRSRGDVIEWDYDLRPSTVIATHTDITHVKNDLLKNGDEGTADMAQCIEKHESVSVEASAGKKLLIVDDNCLIALHLSELLTRLGYFCVNAMSGIEALEIVKNNCEFDLVLLDLEMPEIDGVTTLKLLKDIKNDIPVIANTGYFDNNCTDKLLCSGFDDVISKPVQEVLLLEKIEKLLSLNSKGNNAH